MNDTPEESCVNSPSNTGTLQSLDNKTKFFKKETKEAVRHPDTNPRGSVDGISA